MKLSVQEEALRKELYRLWLAEISLPSFPLLETYNKGQEDYRICVYERPDSLTQEFREIIGHGRWRWANLTWNALSASR